MEESITKEKLFFAAANGITGFRSYFRAVFDPSEYRRLFILKGGPGTGKSTFMKRLAALFGKNGCDVEGILCSSDPASFDGVILTKGENRVAVIDGTAPHASDPVCPGAIDEIVDLGIAWNVGALEKQREAILELVKEKQTAYGRAYAELGKIQITKRKNEAVIQSKDLTDLLTNAAKGKESVRLISSFSKDGYRTLPLCHNVSISRERGLPHTLLPILRENKIAFTRCPSPFDDSLTEAILVDRIGCFADSEPFTAKDDPHADKARELFAEASEKHFALEAIYRQAMNFEKTDMLYFSVADRIRKLLA